MNCNIRNEMATEAPVEAPTSSSALFSHFPAKPTPEEQDENDVENLSSLFNHGLEIYNDLCRDCDVATNSLESQLKVKNAMKILEKATRLCSLADIFSRNESIEEVATNNLQYFLLPALLGSLTLKLTMGERAEIVQVAEVYFRDFLQRCKDYSLHEFEFKPAERRKTDDEFAQIAYMMSVRANKIRRFKEQQELKLKLKDLKKNMENEHVDEEIKRNYFLTMIESYIYEALDELTSIEREKPLLEQMAEMKKDEKPKVKRRPAPPLRPIIITKDEIQKAVYGAGYPSLPTMTVQEFYDKRVADGVFPDPNKVGASSSGLSLQQAALAGVQLDDVDQESEEKERKIDEDDPETLERMRNFDDYKDEHRRGWGNRMNRS